MANTIRIKRSTGSSAPGTAANAELAFSEGNKTLWYGNGDSGSGVATSVIAIGGSGAFVALDGSLAQTITGVKTFSGAIVLGTPQSGTLTGCTGLPLTTGVTGVLGVANGGTGFTSLASAGIALRGANSDITSLTGLTTPLTVGQGGTGSATLAGANIATLASPTFTGTLNCAALSSSGNVSVGGTLTSTGNVTITGNLTVNGTTTTVNSTITTLDDPIITLGGDTAPSSNDAKDRGVEFRWHDGTNPKLGFFGYDNSTGYMTFIPDASNPSNLDAYAGTAGDIQATNFRGALIGNASTATNVAYSGLTGTVTTWNQNTTGNAATATTATTATNVAYSGLTGTVPTWNQSTTGNAATATTATTAATATNVAYSGLTGTVPTWNQNTTGSAATATTATTATNATNVAVTSDNADTSYFVPFLSAATGNLGLKADAGTGASGLTYNPSSVTLTTGNITAGNITTTNLTVINDLIVGSISMADANVVIAPTTEDPTGGTSPSLTVGYLDGAAGFVTIEGGDLYLSTKTNAASTVSSVNIIFEGSANLHETTLGVVDPTADRTVLLPDASDTLVGKATTDILTNKSISGSTNTISSIANGSLTNSSVTIGSTSVSLGASATTIAGLTSVTSTGFTGALTGNASTATNLVTTRGIYGNNFDGSAALTQVIAGTYGGTGVNNGANTITVAGNVSHAGSFTQTFTATANTSVTLPTSGTLLSDGSSIDGGSY